MMLNFVILIKKRFELRNLIECTKSDYSKACGMDERRKHIIQGYAVTGRRVSLFLGYLLIISVSLFMAKTIFLTIYHSKRNGELRLAPFYEMYYPYNISEIRLYNRWVYGITFFLELYFTAMSALLFFNSIPLGTIFMLHACGQLELVKIQFDNIFENDNVDENLNRIVKRLQYIYRSVYSLFFKYIYFIFSKS
uniref:Odorant Receptor 64 n=1 Tax=Dendrolimus punctatus TaxID=238572 RepID=A0A2K8GL61_9NEOP|nr:Odorant Receptor 64 [Dendrolimus punctatus]